MDVNHGACRRWHLRCVTVHQPIEPNVLRAVEILRSG